MSDPKSTNTTISNMDKEHVWHHLMQHKTLENSDPLVIVEGKGMIITDQNGNDYLDATSGGVWTVNLGYGRESLVKAISDQLIKMPYFSCCGGSEPAAKYADALVKKTPELNRVYYSNSGSEANEKAYKMVRQRAHIIGDGSKHKIIYRDRDYHGTTITTLSTSGQHERKDQYGPFTPGFLEMPHCNCYRCPFGKTYGGENACNIECATALENVIKENDPKTIGSVVLEPVTAGGGVIVPVPEYFPIIRSICNKYDVLLHIDEVVCGLGRTGKWFGYQNFGIVPDIVTTAKGVASGYAAISVTITKDELFDLFKQDPSDSMSYFRDISTFGGCTAGPVAALKTLEIIEEENLLDNINTVGDYFFDQLLALQDKHPCIGEVRGIGLLLGLELVKDRKTKEPMDEQMTALITSECLNNGVMIGRTNRSFKTLNNTLLFSPSFICGKSEVDQILTTLDKAIGKLV